MATISGGAWSFPLEITAEQKEHFTERFYEALLNAMDDVKGRKRNRRPGRRYDEENKA